MSIEAMTGVISWTSSAPGSYPVTVRATNGEQPDGTQSFTINVSGTAPIITSTPVTAASLGSPYSYDVEAAGNPAPSYSLDSSPPEMSIEAMTGVISWTPSAPGSYPVTVRATNGEQPDATQSFTINVSGAAPIITSTPVTEASIGSPYFYDVDAEGNPAPSYSLDSSPPGMSIEAMTGVITWTPSAPGSYPVTVRATNGEQPDGTQSFTINVSGAAPIITSTPVTEASIGSPYFYDVEATGTPTPTYALNTSPPGMSINTATGLVSWTPTAPGSYPVTVRALNGQQPDAVQSFTIEVGGASPLIVSTPVTTALLGSSYSYDVEATGTPAPTYSLDTSPPGMNINGGAGLITWTPNEIGSYKVAVRAANGIQPDAIQTFSIEVGGIAPTITSTPVTTVALGTTYTYDVNAIGNPSQTFFLELAPDGMEINTNSGVITWIPDAIGAYDVTVVAENGVEPAARQSFTITVMGSAPTISSSPVTTVQLGNTYMYDVEASGIPEPSFILVDAPAEMTMNEVTGVISWEPTSVGTFAVIVSATNGVSPDDIQSFSVVVKEANLAITSTPVVSGIVEEVYTYDVNATGFSNPTYTLTEAPPGMVINEFTGLITWTPTAAGTYPVSILVSSGGGQQATQSFILTIFAEGLAPSITSTPLDIALVNRVYTYDVSAEGNPAPTYSLVDAPAKMSIDPLSGRITWTPEVEGEFEVVVEALNGYSPAAMQSFILVASNAPFAPIIASTPIKTASVHDRYAYKIEAPGNPDPFYTLITAPAGMRVDPVSGVITWIPMEQGDYEVTVEVSNGVPPAAVQSFVLTVTEADFAPVFRSVPVSIAVLNGYYTYSAEATGNPSPSYALNVAPSGMSIDPVSGLITWEANVPGSHAIEVRASNGVGPGDVQKFTLIVTEDTFAPLITSLPVTMSALDTPYKYKVEATSNPNPLYQLDGPPGMQIDSVSGLVTWTPEDMGEYEVIVTATNGVVPDEVQSYTLIVTADNFAPTIYSRPETQANVNALYSYEVIATGSPLPSFSLESAPDGMWINEETGSITWMPDKGGKVGITVTATNGILPNATQSFVIDVGSSIGTSTQDVDVFEFELLQNYPNPFTNSTTIEYTLQKPDYIEMAVYDLLGRQVHVLEGAYQSEGTHRVLWQGQDARGSELPAGIYFVRIRLGQGEAQVMSVVKLN